jgi:hypothetical protein
LKKITKKCIFPLKFLHFLAPGSGSGFPIRIRIHKVTESGSNPNPDPQPWLKFFHHLVNYDKNLNWESNSSVGLRTLRQNYQEAMRNRSNCTGEETGEINDGYTTMYYLGTPRPSKFYFKQINHYSLQLSSVNYRYCLFGWDQSLDGSINHTGNKTCH